MIPTSSSKKIPEGYDVYHWPEFKAFAKRLGIPWELPTYDLTIFIPVVGTIKITHSYRGEDIPQE